MHIPKAAWRRSGPLASLVARPVSGDRQTSSSGSAAALQGQVLWAGGPAQRPSEPVGSCRGGRSETQAPRREGEGPQQRVNGKGQEAREADAASSAHQPAGPTDLQTDRQTHLRCTLERSDCLSRQVRTWGCGGSYPPPRDPADGSAVGRATCHGLLQAHERTKVRRGGRGVSQRPRRSPCPGENI